jgi:hypothetical protein
MKISDCLTYELVMRTKNDTPLYYMRNEGCYYTTDKKAVYDALSEDIDNAEEDPVGAYYATNIMISLVEKGFKEITQEDLDKLLYIENPL